MSGICIVFSTASKGFRSHIFISLTYTMEVGKNSPKDHRLASKAFSNINSMLTELVVNYQNRNLMEVNKLDSADP